MVCGRCRCIHPKCTNGQQLVCWERLPSIEFESSRLEQTGLSYFPFREITTRTTTRGIRIPIYQGCPVCQGTGRSDAARKLQPTCLECEDDFRMRRICWSSMIGAGVAFVCHALFDTGVLVSAGVGAITGCCVYKHLTLWYHQIVAAATS